MDCVKTCFLIFVLLTFVELYQCGRYGGSYDDEIQSTVGPDNWGSELQALAYQSQTRRSRTTARRTNPPTTARRVRTTARRTNPPTTPRRVRTTARRTNPPTTQRIRTTQRWVQVTTRRPTTTRRTQPTTRPWVTATTRRTATTRPWVTATTRKTVTTRPWVTVTTRRTITTRPTTRVRVTTRTYPTPTPTPWWKTTRWTPPPTTRRPQTTTRRYNKKETSWVDLPPPPGSKIKHGKTTIKIINKYNYHYPGYYSIPVQNPHYHGYYQTYSTYHYSPSDTGSGILGFYLGYRLGKLSTPTYSHESFYDGYRPRYDHYTIHHYYHNAQTIPKKQEIVSNAIMGCVGDSTTICPANTTSLCTSDGTLMCVVAATALTTCKDANNHMVSCASSTMSCTNNTAPECVGTNKTSVVVDIPCLSTADIYGDIKFANNTIVKSTVPPNGTTTLSGFVPLINQTLNNGTTNDGGMKYVNNNETLIGTMNSTVGTGGMKYVNNNETLATINGTTNLNGTVANNETLSLPTTTPSSTTSEYWKWKRSVDQPSQQFCVTIVASPAKRAPTQGEEFLEDANSMLQKFIETAWNL